MKISNNRELRIIKRQKMRLEFSNLQNIKLRDLLIEHNIKPMYGYENLTLDYIQKEIRKDLGTKAGVYMIFNNITGNFYIGGSKSELSTSLCNHLLFKVNNKLIKEDIDRHNISSFVFIVLEIITENDKKDLKTLLIERKQYYMNYLKPTYNISKSASGTSGVMKSQEVRDKIIKTKIEKNHTKSTIILNLDRSVFGIYPTIQAAADALGTNKSSIHFTIKSSDSHLYMDKYYIFYYTDDFNIENVLNNNDKNNNKIRIWNLEKTNYTDYRTITDAIRDLGISKRAMYDAINSETKIIKNKWIVELLNRV